MSQFKIYKPFATKISGFETFNKKIPTKLTLAIKTRGNLAK